MAIWMNNIVMPLLVGDRLTTITHRESDLMGRHKDLQRARVVMALMNKGTRSIKVLATNGKLNREVKVHWFSTYLI